MSRLEDLAERVERLLLRHDELKRTNARLTAARSRIDALLERLPIEDDASHRSGT
jgi:cell division protein ZapB